MTSNPAGINVPVGATASATFNTNTSITLSVTNGREAIWSGGCSSGGNKRKTCTFVLNGNATVTANVEAVGFLRNRYGMPDASPFEYVCGLSEHLNIYCEPPAFLDAAEREVFQPIAFYGSLPALEGLDRVPAGDAYFTGGDTRLKVYLSFGTVIWPIREAEAIAALQGFVDGLDRLGNTSAVISLGNANVDRSLRAALVRPGVSVETYVDQWKILQEADLFVTHHGLNSTHEAIFHRVPMISYPFAWDQPGLARTCQRLGLAVPVVEEPMAEIHAADADRALRLAQERRDEMLAALAVASEWEREVVAGRPVVLQQVLDLAR